LGPKEKKFVGNMPHDTAREEPPGTNHSAVAEIEASRLKNICDDMSMWNGVTIVNDRIRKISLGHCFPQLGGPLAQEIGNLSALVHLNLSENRICGKICGSTFSRLNRLQTLNLSHNALTVRVFVCGCGEETLQGCTHI
jgi:hypothetical protein